MISFVVAMDESRVIGYKNDIPWQLPNDLKFFKEKTTGHKIVMGRKTFDSIGKALPNRENIVLTRNKKADSKEDITIMHDISDVYELDEKTPDEEICVIGGARIFEQMLPKADRMYITCIDHAFKGDTYFPEFSKEQWQETSKSKGKKDENNPYDYYFVQYDRNK